MMSADFFAPFSELASKLLPLLSGSDGAHDLSHLIRVWRNVKAIQREEGGDLEILAAAVLLHDCVDVPKNSPLRSQASRLAAVEAVARLSALGWSEKRSSWVASTIESHSYSAGVAPVAIEGRILQDADRLDAIGFTGIARCFYTAGRLASQLYDPVDPTASASSLDDRRFALDHFPQKLLKLADNFTTVTGQRLAEARAQALEGFYRGMV